MLGLTPTNGVFPAVAARLLLGTHVVSVPDEIARRGDYLGVDGLDRLERLCRSLAEVGDKTVAASLQRGEQLALTGYRSIGADSAWVLLAVLSPPSWPGLRMARVRAQVNTSLAR